MTDRITQAASAATIGITQSYYSKLINAKSRPSYRTAKRLEAAIGVPLRIWMEGTAEEIQAALADAAQSQTQEAA